jgi:1-acyl-sn-glycerol-3-phosphate acyltransferase
MLEVRRLFYSIGKVVMWIGMHFLYRVKITGSENIPQEGAFILCANHIHAMDGVMLAVKSRRRLYFMGKKEVFKNKLAAFFLKALGGFPVDRSATDLAAYKQAVNILNDGKALMLFSQGTRMEGFDNAKSGAAMFALKANAPIIPVGIKGSYKFRSLVEMKVGEPISMEEYAGKRIKTALVEEVMDKGASGVKGLIQ